VGLAKTRIFSLVEDRSGALWFGSITGGASRYDGKSFTKFTDKDGLGNNDVQWIFEDRDAHIWLGTGNGASRYDGKSMTNFTTKEGLVHNSVYAIAQDASGRIWFGTQGGISSYDGKSFSNLADQVGRPFVNVRTIVVDRSGNLWFGGQEGAFRYDGKTLATFTSKEGLLDDFVGSMIVDQAGNIWLGHPGGFPGGTGGGASRYDGTVLQAFHSEGWPCEPHRLLHAPGQGRATSGSAASMRAHAATTARLSPTSPHPPRLCYRPRAGQSDDCSNEAGLARWCCFARAQSPLVLQIAHLLQPLHHLAIKLFLDGDVCHACGGRSAVPVLLTGRDPDHIAWADFLDGAPPNAAHAHSRR
jgi:streptogramin lyase